MKTVDIYKFPSSIGQQQLWLIQELNPHSSFYNISNCVRLFGSLNYHALEQSVLEICRRHEILRTVFDHCEGKLFQFIWSHLTISLKMISLENLSRKEQQASILNYTQQESHQYFDLKSAPPWRISLLILNPGEHILLTTFHHIIFDEWSLEIFQKELSTIYNNFSEGSPSQLAELSIQYADYVVYQQKYFQSLSFQKDLKYWNSRLTETEFSLNLPTDWPRPPKPTYRGKTESFEIPTDIQNKLLKITREKGTTSFMLFLTAYVVLLYKYTQTKDILVGIPVTMRNNPDVQNIIGLFLNTVVLRSRVVSEQTFVDMLAHTRQTILKAYNHCYLPFGRLVQEIQSSHSFSQHPMFQVMFVYSHEIENMTFNNLQTQPIPIPNQVSKFDMTLFLTQSKQGLQVDIEYSIDLFKTSTIQRMIGHFMTLLNAIAENPKMMIAELPILTKAEYHQLLIEWNHVQA